MIEIRREIQTPEYTEGYIYVDGVEIGQTLELPWRNNKTDISCIPACTDAYRLVKREWGKFARAYKKRWGHDGSLQIKVVAGRKVILIHTGTATEHTLGCVLVGLKAGDGRLRKSRDTYAALWDALEPHWEAHEDVGIPISVYRDFPEIECEMTLQERMAIKPEDL